MKRIYLLIFSSLVLSSCSKNEIVAPSNDPQVFQFKEIGSIDLGNLGASEISAFDSKTKKLFVVNNAEVNKIDVLDLSNPSQPVVIGKILIDPYGGFVNSVSVADGKLAAAIESKNKQENGKCVVFNTTDYSEIKSITVGALPDMVTFSPDGNYILTANEGEPSADYAIDPEGSVSIISVREGYSVKTLNFAGFESQLTLLKSKGLRVFGPKATLAKDIEPEYITVSSDSKMAWVTLQENNAIAKVDLNLMAITEIMPLGFKNHTIAEDAGDFSDKDAKVGSFQAVSNLKGIYMPDGIAVYEYQGIPFLFTANEGDAREYGTFIEAKRVKDIKLDPTKFPLAADLQKETSLGRLNITTTLGDSDGDGDFDELFSFGARSMSVWNGISGNLIFDTHNEIDSRNIQLGLYDDTRSDDKGSEPEGVVIGKIGEKSYAFVGNERSDSFIIYDISNPYYPSFIKAIPTGDAPEGILFIPAEKSPNGKPIVITSCENDGQVKIFSF